MNRSIALVAFVGLFHPVNTHAEGLKTLQRLEVFLQRNASYSFQSIPVQVRQVPFFPFSTLDSSGIIHPIEQSSASLHIWTIGVRYGFGLWVGNFEVQGGPALHVFGPFTIPDRVLENGGDEFRYYKVQSSLATIRLAASAMSPYLKLWNNRGFRVGVGVEIGPLGVPLKIEAGRDRFNDEEVWRTFSFGTLREHASSVRLEYRRLSWSKTPSYLEDEDAPSFFLELGRTWGKFSPKPDFRSVSTISKKPLKTLHIAFGVKYHLVH